MSTDISNTLGKSPLDSPHSRGLLVCYVMLCYVILYVLANKFRIKLGLPYLFLSIALIYLSNLIDELKKFVVSFTRSFGTLYLLIKDQYLPFNIHLK